LIALGMIDKQDRQAGSTSRIDKQDRQARIDKVLGRQSCV